MLYLACDRREWRYHKSGNQHCPRPWHPSASKPLPRMATRVNSLTLRSEGLRTLAKMHRQLAAVLFADVAGYTRLMDAYEAETHPRLMALLGEVVEPMVADRAGRIVKAMGDGFLACFASVNSAVQAAASIQREVNHREAHQPREKADSLSNGPALGRHRRGGRDQIGISGRLSRNMHLWFRLEVYLAKKCDQRIRDPIVCTDSARGVNTPGAPGRRLGSGLGLCF